MVKIPDKLKKAIDRMPPIFRLQTIEAVNFATFDALDIGCDASIMSCIITLIEDFDWSTDCRSKKIEKFMKGVQERMNTFAARDGDAFAEGMRQRLENYGVYYSRKDKEK